MDKAAVERFEAKTRRDGDCLIWTGTRHHKGYGKFRTGSKGTRRMSFAHRVAYELAHGEVPKGLCVLHRCDNPPCVNPRHLFTGTHADNMRDCIAKGRRAVTAGEANGMSKLSAADIPQIRTMYAQGGVTQARIAADFGVSQMTISRVILGKNWGSI